jgi:hypothetical protein
VIEMDSTTVILPGHHGRIDTYGNILIWPDKFRPARKTSQNGSGATRARTGRARAVSRPRSGSRKPARRTRR